MAVVVGIAQHQLRVWCRQVANPGFHVDLQRAEELAKLQIVERQRRTNALDRAAVVGIYIRLKRVQLAVFPVAD